MRRRKTAAHAEETGTVLDLNNDGAGVVRDAKTVFVPGALPGERIRFRRTRTHRSYDEAELLEVLAPSADRVQPRCAHFGTCGGCALQHLAPEAQVAAKQRELAESLRRIAQAEPDRWLVPLIGPPWNYRRRARLSAKFVPKQGRTLVGFRGRRSAGITTVERCEILETPLDALVGPLGDLLTSLQARDAVSQIEVAVGDERPVLVLRVLRSLAAADLSALEHFAAQHDVQLGLQRGGLDTVEALGGGRLALSYSIPELQLSWEFAPTDFVQVNALLNRQLVVRAVELLDPGPSDRVLDLFCGLGNFTLPLARRAGHCVGVEGDPGLVACATRNAVRNAVDNAEFHAADLSALDLRNPPGWSTGPFSHVLLDPPRLGAEALMPWLAELAPQRVVYISCHPATLARDIGILMQCSGLRLRAAGVIDMFPHTTHVESIAVLEPGLGDNASRKSSRI